MDTAAIKNSVIAMFAVIGGCIAERSEDGMLC